MFERFTIEARETVMKAVEEAADLGDTRVGTEHLLLAGLASPNLAHLGMSREMARQALARLDQIALAGVGIDSESIGEVSGARPLTRRGHLPFTGGAKECLTGALKEAIALRHRHIGVEHIVLALTTRPEADRATRALKAIDIDPAGLRETLLEELKQAS